MYPLFEIPIVGGPILIAAIATFHIIPSHVATGAFWITYFIERKALRENRPELLEFLKKLSLSILIFCFVTGSLTGVGIWFAATVLSPRAISGLIHTYVWGWAAEWVFFVIEIVAIYVYYYTFDKINPKTHLRIGLIYAVAAWFSMVIITGILGFMLTPGGWLETGGFFAGFFNQTYWPQLLFRTAMMFAIVVGLAEVVDSLCAIKELLCISAVRICQFQLKLSFGGRHGFRTQNMDKKKKKGQEDTEKPFVVKIFWTGITHNIERYFIWSNDSHLSDSKRRTSRSSRSIRSPRTVFHISTKAPTIEPPSCRLASKALRSSPSISLSLALMKSAVWSAARLAIFSYESNETFEPLVSISTRILSRLLFTFPRASSYLILISRISFFSISSSSKRERTSFTRFSAWDLAFAKTSTLSKRSSFFESLFAIAKLQNIIKEIV